MERTMRNVNGTIRAEFNRRCAEFYLDKGQSLRIDPQSSPLSITSQGSILWVTRANDITDYLLERNQSVAMPGRGLVVIEAIQPGNLRVTLG